MNAPELRLPPHSVESEQSVIGGLLLDSKAWDRVCDVVAEADFYRDDHRRIFKHIQRLCEAGKPADIVTVWAEIEKSNEAEQVGGLAYLGDIANNTPSAANIRRYAEIIADRARKRRLITVGDEIAAMGFGAMDSAQAMDEAQGLLQAIANDSAGKGEPIALSVALSRAIDRVQEMFDRGDKSGVTGLPTGFADMDALLHGLNHSDLIILAGRPSMGKTTLAMNIAEHASLEGKHVAVFSLEMGAEALATRSLSAVSGVEFERLRAGQLHDDDWDKLTAGLGKMHQAPMTIDETGGLSVTQIAARCRRIARRQKIDLIVVDYLQLIRPGYSSTASNRNDEVTAISAGLKALAKDMHCPVIALSQLSRKVEERADKRPLMSDLRDSGSIEQDADVIMLMYRDDYYRSDSPWAGMAEANIAKHRNGRTGTVNLVFQADRCRFKDASHEAIADANRRAHEARPVKQRRGME